MGWTLTLEECTFQEIRIECHHPTINAASVEALFNCEYIFI